VTFRVRVTLLCAGALVIALGAVGVLAYVGERGALSGELDALLRARAAQVTPAVVRDVLAASDLLPKQRGPGMQLAAPRPGEGRASQAGRRSRAREPAWALTVLSW
jgi:hypothetical protein